MPPTAPGAGSWKSLSNGCGLYPIPLAGSATALAIEAGRVLNFPDVMNGADVPAALRAPAEVAGLNYSLVMAPLMQGGAGHDRPDAR